MASKVLYDDGRCLLDEQGVTLRRYYFPFATRKRIHYSQIRHVQARRMDWWTGKGRLWGTSHPGYWLPLDAARPHKQTLIGLELDTYVKPAFSPDEPDSVLRLLHERVSGDRTVE